MATTKKSFQDLQNQRLVEEADRERQLAAEKGAAGELTDEERERALKRMKEAGIPPFTPEGRR